MTDNPQTEAARRERYATAIRETDGWVLDDGQHMIDAVMAVADAELAARRAADLRDAEEICDEAGASYTAKALNEQADGAYGLMARFRRKAEEAEQTAAAPAVPAPPTTTTGDRAALREPVAEAIHRAMHPSRSWTRQSDEIREQCFQAADEVLSELPPSASQDSASADEVAHAIDNATPYPIELDSALCRFMAQRLLEMLTIVKRPEHPVWQPEEQSEPSPCPQPQDPDAVLAVLPEPAGETPATEETR